MPGYLLHTNAVVQCTHGIPAQIPPVQPRVLVSMQPVAVMSSQIMVPGCPFTVPPGKPQPCVLIKWLMPSARVKVMGQPALVAMPGPGAGICQSPDQIPNGPPIVSTVQPRVFAM